MKYLGKILRNLTNFLKHFKSFSKDSRHVRVILEKFKYVGNFWTNAQENFENCFKIKEIFYLIGLALFNKNLLELTYFH